MKLRRRYGCERAADRLGHRVFDSNGVWETIGNEEAVDLLKDVMDPDTAAKLLVDRAAEQGTSILWHKFTTVDRMASPRRVESLW